MGSNSTSNKTPAPAFKIRVPPPGGIVDLYELELFPFFFRESEKELAAMFAVEQRNIDEQIAAGAEETLNDSGLVAADYFAMRSRRSHIIYLTSLLQTALDRSSATLARLKGHSNWKVIVRAYPGNAWENKRDYLYEHGGIQIAPATWGVLSLMVLLRNNLVHANGEVDELNSANREALQALPGLVLKQYEMSVGAATVEHCFAATHEAVETIQTGLRKVYGHLHGAVL